MSSQAATLEAAMATKEKAENSTTTTRDGIQTKGVTLKNVSKSFGDVKAVIDLNLKVEPAEFFAMLGPSGSGKTTVLRLIAGFETPDTGEIFLGEQNVTEIPPYHRDVNTVFQDYALFPHMTVAQNIAYGLKAHKVPKEKREKLVAEALDRVKLPFAADR
jgi:putative spermidine/putrescine transport system ATP-binding protein